MPEFERLEEALAQEISRLADNHFHGVASDHDARRLNQLVAESPAARRYYVSYMLGTASLNFLADDRFVCPQITSEVERSAGLAKSPWSPSYRQPFVRLWNRAIDYISTPVRFGLFVASISMISLVLTLAAFRWNGSVRNVAAQQMTAVKFASVSAEAACSWSPQSGANRVGDAFGAGSILDLKTGWAEIAFDGGTVVVVEGPARLILQSSRDVYLDHGQLVCRVARTDPDFTIHTLQADVVDLGTEFGVSVIDSSIEVHVFQGAVEVRSPGLESPKQADAGEAVRVTLPDDRKRNGELQAIGCSAERFVRTLQRDAWGKYESPRLKAAIPAAEYDNALIQDQDLLVFYNASSRGGDRIRNLAQSGAVYDGRLLGGQWREELDEAPSRFLHLESGNDGVALHIPDELTALTVATRVRINSPPSSNSMVGLLMSDGWFTTGQLHWQVKPPTFLSFGVWGMEGRKELEARGAKLFGRWVHLAVTYDQPGGRIAYFVDGRLVNEELVQKHGVVRIGAATWGNWRKRLKSEAPRSLTGDLAELMVYRRVLNAEEILLLSTAGPTPPDSNAPGLPSETPLGAAKN